MERTVGIGRMPCLGHLAAIGISQRHIDCAVGDRLVVASFVVACAGDPLVEDNLAWAMNATVSDQHDRGGRIGLRVLPKVGCIGADFVPFTVQRGRGHKHNFRTSLIGLEFVAAILVCCGRAPFHKALLLAHKLFHGCTDGRFARGTVDNVPRHNALRLLRLRPARRTRHDCKSRHPDHRGVNHVVVFTKVSLLAGQHPVSAWLKRLSIECVSQRNVVLTLLEIRRNRQISSMFFESRQGHNCLAFIVVEIRRVWLTGLESAQPISMSNPDMHLGKIAVRHADHRPRLGPRALRLE